MTRMNRFLGVLALLMIAAGLPLLAAETGDVLARIERLGSFEGQMERSLWESVADDIEKNPAPIARALVPKLSDNELTELQLTVYVWALGQTKEPTMMSVLEALHGQSKSDHVKASCLQALASIGGRQAADFLLGTLDATTDKEMRFHILSLLGQMQYEAALPKMEEVLKQDPNTFYWHSIFIFGKMGDKAVPFLLERIKSNDPNVRANVINVVGQWLIPPEAGKILQDLLWTEKDAKLRRTILSSLEGTIADFEQMKTVFEQVVAKEKDAEMVKFARETLANLDQMKTGAAALAQKKQPSAPAFQREYTQLFRSMGLDGDYEVLGASSTAQDEPKLKALRERILQRNSDESFYDYQEVNAIIAQNRLWNSLERKKASNKADADAGREPRAPSAVFGGQHAMTQYLHLPFAVALLIAVGWTTLFSLTNKLAIRGFRNLGILASYILVVVFLFVAGWRLALVTWAAFGLAGGLLYVAWETLERRHAAPGQQDPGVSLVSLLHGLFLWPIMVPEAVEYALADLGILRTPPAGPTNGIAESGAVPDGGPATPLVNSGITQGPPSVN